MQPARSSRKESIMRTSVKALALTAVVAVSGATGFAERASAASAPRACPYQYVVSNGVANNVVTYKTPRGSARLRSIRPNERFVVLFGGDGGAPDQVGDRHLTDRGWVSFPRAYLRANGRCVAVTNQSLRDAALAFEVGARAASAAIEDLGRALRATAR
jgi:hypothetical protein